jgi:hypothetical protein
MPAGQAARDLGAKRSDLGEPVGDVHVSGGSRRLFSS